MENHGAAMKNVAAARNNDGATKNKRAREEASPEPPAEARPLGHRSCRAAPPRPRPTRGHEALTQKARKFNAREICTNLDSSSKRAPGRNRARDQPLQRRTQDHRATSPAAGPRRAHGSAAAKRARPRKRANLARGKICNFGPELGFEQRNRFRSLRDTRRTKKKVLRKPPAGAPVVGQTFKYIY